MNTLLCTEKGLPPGLWLPTQYENTEKYLVENFAHPNHDYEDIVDFGSFLVAMTVLNMEGGERTSTMPLSEDVELVHAAGYGLSLRLLSHQYGGLKKLQGALGYYPDGFEPTAEELLDRFRWIANYAHARDSGDTELHNVEDVIRWGAERDLTPAFNRVYKILGGDTFALRSIFDVEKRNSPSITALHLYRFGDKVIRENGKPIGMRELNEKYTEEFVSTPYETIRAAFGTYTKFWLEFDYVPTSSGLSEREIVDIGVRWAIKNGSASIQTRDIEQLSKAMRFPSRLPIRRYFGSIPAFRDSLIEEYYRYTEIRNEFAQNGVEPHVFEAACRKFETTPEFSYWLKLNIEPLTKLSNGSEASRFVLRIMHTGFNLEDNDIFILQLEDVKKSLRSIGIRSLDDQRFIFDLIPRIRASEVL